MSDPAPLAPDLDGSFWAYLDRCEEVGGGKALSLLLQCLKDPQSARRWAELALDHLLIREVLEEQAAWKEVAKGQAGRGRQTAGPTDAELVWQAEQGVPGAFDILVERYSALIVGAAYSHLKDHEQALDVAQDAFLEAAEKLNTLRVREKFGHWVYGIARRKAIYFVRRRSRLREIVQYKQDEERALLGPDDPGAPLAREERNRQIRSALNEIPEIYREVIVLKYIDNRSYEEIAGLLGISLAAVDKRLMRGKDMLRESLRRWTGEQ